MTIKSLDPIQIIKSDFQQVFDAATTGAFTSDTLYSLERLHWSMITLELENHIFETSMGTIQIIEDGVSINLHDSDDSYFYCADCGNVTKQTSKVIHTSQTHLN